MLNNISKQKDPKPEGDSLVRHNTSTHKGLHCTFAAVLSYYGTCVMVRVCLFATLNSCAIREALLV